MKTPRNESGEAAAAVLLIADALQMFDAIFNRFDVTEHHRRARFQTEFMRDLHDFEPFVAVDLERRDFFAHAIDQDLAAAAGDRSESGVLEF